MNTDQFIIDNVFEIASILDPMSHGCHADIEDVEYEDITEESSDTPVEQSPVIILKQ